MVRPGVWKLTVTVRRYADGSQRRVHTTVHAANMLEANRALARFVSEIRNSSLPASKPDRHITVDEAVEQFLTEHLQGERGREQTTIEDYRSVHTKWFTPDIGGRRLRDIDEATIDRLLGRMRQAGLSSSRMNSARNLYGPLFRWAKRRGIVQRSPMAEFQLPTRLRVEREHRPREVDQLVRYLATAVEHVSDVAPVLTLGAVTGMRRGELVSIRRSALDVKRRRLRVDTAIAGKRVKTTKTRKEREIFGCRDGRNAATHCEEMDKRAEACEVEVGPDGFVFSLDPDCSRPMPAEYLTQRVATLKEHLGISNSLRLRHFGSQSTGRLARPDTAAVSAPLPEADLAG